jgi:diphthine synthase
VLVILLNMLLIDSRSPFRAVYSSETIAVGVARIGTETQCIVSGTLQELLDVDYGPPLHSLVVPGELHVMEKELLATFACRLDTPRVHKVSEHSDEEDGGAQTL